MLCPYFVQHKHNPHTNSSTPTPRQPTTSPPGCGPHILRTSSLKHLTKGFSITVFSQGNTCAMYIYTYIETLTLHLGYIPDIFVVWYRNTVISHSRQPCVYPSNTHHLVQKSQILYTLSSECKTFLKVGLNCMSLVTFHLYPYVAKSAF
jgi:hypothetical protein